MFYSEFLNVCQIDNTCAKCKKTFAKWSLYYTHITTVTCVSTHQPSVVSSKRNLIGVKQPLSDVVKMAVVKSWEEAHKGALIG